MLWYTTTASSTGWEAMFPGEDVFSPDTYSPGSVIGGSCVIGTGSTDAFIYHLYDVNSAQAVVGRAAVSGFDTDLSPNLHAVMLLPPIGCGRGDTDLDGDVDFDDLLHVLSEYGSCTSCIWCPGDFDGDNIVGFSDVVIILANWTLDCSTFDGPPTSVTDCIERYGLDPVALEACVQWLNAQP